MAMAPGGDHLIVGTVGKQNGGLLLRIEIPSSPGVDGPAETRDAGRENSDHNPGCSPFATAMVDLVLSSPDHHTFHATGVHFCPWDRRYYVAHSGGVASVDLEGNDPRVVSTKSERMGTDSGLEIAGQVVCDPASGDLYAVDNGERGVVVWYNRDSEMWEAITLEGAVPNGHGLVFDADELQDLASSSHAASVSPAERAQDTAREDNNAAIVHDKLINNGKGGIAGRVQPSIVAVGSDVIIRVPALARRLAPGNVSPDHAPGSVRAIANHSTSTRCMAPAGLLDQLGAVLLHPKTGELLMTDLSGFWVVGAKNASHQPSSASPPTQTATSDMPVDHNDANVCTTLHRMEGGRVRNPHAIAASGGSSDIFAAGKDFLL
jgi:hypothetical protein